MFVKCSFQVSFVESKELRLSLLIPFHKKSFFLIFSLNPLLKNFLFQTTYIFNRRTTNTKFQLSKILERHHLKIFLILRNFIIYGPPTEIFGNQIFLHLLESTYSCSFEIGKFCFLFVLHYKTSYIIILESN